MKQLLATLAVLMATTGAGCNSVSSTSKSEPPRPAEQKSGQPLAGDRSTRAEGQVVFLEKSGANLYLELRAGDRTVGVELLPAVARVYGGKVNKGDRLAVEGKRLAGDKEIAFVVEVGDPAKVTLGVDKPPPGRPGPGTTTSNPPVEMIAAYGMWPPFDEDEIRDRVNKAHKDSVGRLVIDTGLTELYRAYQDPSPYLDVVKQAAAAAKRQGISTAFYLPAFEIRREKETRGKVPLARWQPTWPQYTLGGRPVVKTAFGKDEFWNRAGDEAMWVCPSSPWRNTFVKRVQEAVKRGARTVFIDVPYFQASDKQMTCRCRYCQARFKKETGLTIPDRPRPGQLTYHRWLWWRHQLLARFFARLKQAIRAANPRGRLVVEEYPAYIEGATTATGLDIGLISDEVDVFAHEYSAKQFDKSPYSFSDRVNLAATLALYRGLDDARPTWVLSYAHTPADSRVSAALHLCYDASFWETKGPEMNDTTVGRVWRRKLFAWFEDHQRVFGGSRQRASVAVLYSPASRDFGGKHLASLMDTVRTLVRAAVPFRVLSTRDLDQLGDYHTVVLPDVVALAAEDAKRLRAHEGPLLVVGRAPSRDRWGIKKTDHRLKLHRSSLGRLAGDLGQLPVEVSGGTVAANLVTRKGELQLRLANLKPRTARVKVRLTLPGKPRSATVLPLLGRERKLELSTDHDGATTFAVQVADLAVVRMQTRQQQ